MNKKVSGKEPEYTVAQVQFLNLGKDRGESINSYVMRIFGAAVGYKFEV